MRRKRMSSINEIIIGTAVILVEARLINNKTREDVYAQVRNMIRRRVVLNAY